MQTLYDKTVEKIEDIYHRSLITARANKQDMERLESAQKLALKHFTAVNVFCTLFTHYDMTPFPISLRMSLSGGNDDDLLKLLLELPPVLVPEACNEIYEGAIVVKVEEGSEFYNAISIASRLGNKFELSLAKDEFPRDWLLATVDRYIQISGPQSRVFMGVDMAKAPASEVTA